MAKTTKSNKKDRPEPIRDEDNPSMIKVGDKLCLRVFEDFFVEKELPKWKRFAEMKKEFEKTFGDLDYSDDEIKRRVSSKADVDPAHVLEDPADVIKRRDELKKMRDIIRDDRWGIQDKHEREVNDAIKKCAVFVGYRPTTLGGKVSKFFDRFRKHPKFVLAEVAFEDLKNHMMVSSSDEVKKADLALDRLIETYNKAGQYAKVEEVKKIKPQLACEVAVSNCGFTKYVSEEQMLDFLKKTERGVMVNFLRYYEGVIPDEVVQKKVEADEKGLFDNYVVAYYCDTVKKAMSIVKKEKDAKKDAATARRRDPILFGMVKGVRKLYYITDWVTPEDDLTLEALEKVLGEKARTLFELQVEGGADGISNAGNNVDNSSYNNITVNNNNISQYISRLQEQMTDWTDSDTRRAFYTSTNP